MNVNFIFLFLVLIKGMKKGGEFKIFLCYRRDSGVSPQFCRDEVA